MSLVLDASVAIAWVGEDTTLPVVAVFDMLKAAEAWVPALWYLEVANVLEIGIRRKKHNAAFRDEALADLAVYPIRLDLETVDRAWNETLHLASRHLLTVYDASYLEISLRRGLPLATLDRALKDAARSEGVTLLCP